MYARTICFLIFATCCLTGIGCFWFLISVHKTRYRNLWDREKKKDSIWFPYENKVWHSFERETPYWVKQEKDALVALWTLRISQYLAFASFIGFIYFSLERVN